MPGLKDPLHEARRMAAVREALALGKPWMSSTGPTSSEGKRTVSKNAFKHGLTAIAFRWAVRYCTEVERALTSAPNP